jgi:hypothetical protein
VDPVPIDAADFRKVEKTRNYFFERPERLPLTGACGPASGYGRAAASRKRAWFCSMSFPVIGQHALVLNGAPQGRGVLGVIAGLVPIAQRARYGGAHEVGVGGIPGVGLRFGITGQKACSRPAR